MQAGKAPFIVKLQDPDCDTGHERIRREELKLASRWVPAGAKVLELGGGSGFQAALLASEGCQVVSIDVAQMPSAQTLGFQKQYWPVEVYDGRHFPCGDGEFDVVYSSHMLHHALERMPEFTAEVRRVLQPGGVTLHIVPSASWRWWNNVGFYADLFRRLCYRLSAKRSAAGGPVTASGNREAVGLGTRLSRILFPPPVGCGKNTTSQLRDFRRRHWMAGFRKAGWFVESTGSGLFYTGFLFLPGLPIPVRRFLAKLLGSSSHVIVGHPPI